MRRSRPEASAHRRSTDTAARAAGTRSFSLGANIRRESRYIAAAMSAADKARPLTKADARRIWLRAQRLDTPAPFGGGPQATAAAVEHLGYVQIDTINVIERSHHHVLWSRIPRIPARGSAPGPERRQERVRILDPCAVLRADPGFALLHPGHEAASARRSSMVQFGQSGRPAQGDDADPARRRPDHP